MTDRITADRQWRFEIPDPDSWLAFEPPEYDKGFTLMDADESVRYLALDEWAEDKFGNDPRIQMDDGYAPRDRWYRLESAYKTWIEKHPEDAVDLPGEPPYDLGDQLFLFQ